LNILKNNIYFDGSNGYKTWENQYNKKADEVKESENQRNIFGVLAGVCVLAGGVTFFF